ncbi:sodium:proton antiporter [Kocuria sediminis]|uniref:Sodium:proton antiporter n=1 Tax=Kocuria sediminis TaxID=1038857 RepID=A0A6N8GJD6_9MICC|nr:sodium:proton antiporter [Kocuria sediminis]MUN62380.1 sodium:proton antiporter [Kocuria sediminis]
MGMAVAGVLVVVLMVAVTGVSRRLGVAAPLLLVIVGLALSYAPGVPAVEVPHEWILTVVLPPLLYAAAIKVPVIDFRRNLGAITSLSVVLVLVSAVLTGLVLYALLPDLNLAAAIALGAVVSPPDAVAATSIGKRLGLPPRLVTVLEGEGLVNDATALVLLRSSLAVAAGTMSGVWGGVADFGYAVVVAVAVGLLVGVVTVLVRSKIHDPVLDTALSFVVPFLAFIPAEELGASGVLAVVVAGLYTGHRSASVLDAPARISDDVNWRTVQFLLENAVFLLMGLELRHLVENIDQDLLSIPHTVLIGLLITAVLIVVRVAWVFPLVLLLRRRAGRAERRTMRLWLGLDRTGERSTDPRQERRRRLRQRVYAQRRADLEQERREGLGWRGAVVLGWSGMRGVVTLAAAQSLPNSVPYREQLVLIAFTVAVTTLLLQGGTLPALIRALGIRGIDTTADLRESAALFDEIADAGLRVLDAPDAVLGADAAVDPDVVERVRQDTFLRSESTWERAHAREAKDAPTPHYQYRQLRLAVVREEREALLTARRQGKYPSRILADAQRVLDVEEARLRPRSTGH